MEKFTKLTGVAAPLMRRNVDTDIITPMGRVVSVAREELGNYAFEPWRFNEDGSENPDFVLNRDRFRGAPILLAGDNFGCGSSRETAVWGLWQMGIRCVIAPSFGDIFFGNCFKNGMLPIALPAETVEDFAQQAGADKNDTLFTVDLQTCTVTAPNGDTVSFDVDPARREALLEGLDEIDVTLRRADEITAYQNKDRTARPWIYDLPDGLETA